MSDGYSKGMIIIAVASLLTVVGMCTAVWCVSDGHEVTVETEGEGMVSPAYAKVAHNGSLDIEITAATGWETVSVTVDGETADTDGNVLRLTGILGDRHVKVVFGKITGTCVLEVAHNAGGTVDPDGTATYPLGGKVTAVITPDMGKVIGEVILDGASLGSRNIVDIVMDSDHTLEVTFRDATEDDHRVTVDVGMDLAGSLHGRVIPAGTTCVPAGGSLTVLVEPDPGYCIHGITVNGKAIAPDRRFTVTDITDDVSINIVLGPDTHTVTVGSSGNGTVTPSGTVTVGHGKDLVLTFSPMEGYRLSSLRIDGVYIGAGLTSYTLRNVTSDHEISVEFSEIPPIPPGRDDFSVTVTEVSGTMVVNGNVEEFADDTDRSLTEGNPFRLENMVPGITQTAKMTLNNKSAVNLTATLCLKGLSEIGNVSEFMIIEITANNTVKSCSLKELASGNWNMTLGDIGPHGTMDISVTVTFSEEADNSAMGGSLRFTFGILATDGRP